MKHTFIYISTLLWVLFGAACTDEQNPEGERFSGEGTSLAIKASQGVLAGSQCEAFAAGKQIHIYYAHTNLNTTYPWLQGIYQMPADGGIDSDWESQKWTTSEGEDIKSIYQEDIKNTNGDGQCFFTATSHPVLSADDAKNYNEYKVNTDQSEEADHEASDLVAARAIYSDVATVKKGITLHFRHLLSRLVVKVILPQGKVEDGFFPAPHNLKVTATFCNRQTGYAVDYNNTVKDEGLFLTTVSGGTSDLSMYTDGKPEDVTTSGGGKAASYTFSAILPKQMVQGGKLVTFKISNKDGSDQRNYTYSAPDQNTVELKQETITVIYLTLLSGAGNQKLQLTKVEMIDWKNDNADVGDLLPL